jgi:glyoxylase-like metal-dependent hydrolase (beta-lactamase superfamily II)
MSGTPVLIGSSEPWSGGRVGDAAECVLAPNPSAMTLDGTNTWILGAVGEHGAVLVDPGPDDEKHLAAVVTCVDRRDVTIQSILLTHGHLDHSAGSRMFADEFNAPVSALDPHHVLGGEGLVAGSVLDRGGLEIEVVSTPGHSSDSLSFFIRDHGLILTGDTVLGRGTTVVAHPDGSMAEYLASLHRLQELAGTTGATNMLPGHGPTVADPAGLLRDYLSHREERLEQVRIAIDQGAKSPMEVVDAVYQPIPEQVVPAALASVRAQWDYIRAGN